MRNKVSYLLPMALFVLLTQTLPLMAATMIANASSPPLLFAAAEDAIIAIIMVAYYGVLYASSWVIFTKAGRPGWAALVPIYGTIVFLDIIDRPWTHIFLLLIPIAGIVFAIIMIVELANKFGKETGFALGMVFLGIIFFPMLAFGDAEYEGSMPSQGRRKKKKRRIRDDDDEDEEDRPRSRLKSRSRRDDDDDDDDDDRPRRRSRRDDDDEEEEEERPRRDDDDDDEPPPRPRPRLRPRRDD